MNILKNNIFFLFARTAFLILCFIGLTHCSPKGDVAEELQTILRSLKEKNDLVSVRNATAVLPGIEKLTIQKGNPIKNTRISAKLNRVNIAKLIKHISDQTNIPYIVSKNSPLYGQINANFNNLTITQAFNQILSTINYNAKWENNVIHIAVKPIEIEGDSEDIIHAEIALQNLNTEIARKILDDLHIENKEVSAAELPATNTIYISGKRKYVRNAINTIKKMDHPIPHVVIQAMVVDMSVSMRKQLGMNLSDISYGRISSGGFDFGGITNNLQFTRTSANVNPYELTAIIENLVDESKARLVSRPFVTTLSGQEASLDISRERYILTEEISNVTSFEAITSGVQLSITPTVLSNGQIRMSIDVSDSEFLPAVGNISVELDKNQAKTIMQVADAQTIMIGGLALHRSSDQNRGFPGLRNVPVLKQVFAATNEIDFEQEISIFITPYIWQPNINPPMVEPRLSHDLDHGHLIDSVK